MRQEEAFNKSCNDLEVEKSHLQLQLGEAVTQANASPDPFYSQAHKDRLSVHYSENLASLQ
jgi:hypothetical protein